MTGFFGRFLGLIAWFLGLASGAFGIIAPQTSLVSPWYLGALVGISSLGVILLGMIIREVLQRDTVVAVFGLVTMGILFVMTPVYAGTFVTLTVDVETPPGDLFEHQRVVRGEVYTPDARSIQYVRKDGVSDHELIQTLGGVDRVWTGESIGEYWDILVPQYVAVAAAFVCSVFFLGAFVDLAAGAIPVRKKTKRPKFRTRAARRRR